MRMVTKMADRLLSVVVPRVTASAGCPGTTRKTCYCGTNGYWYDKNCSYYGIVCYEVCGSCYKTVWPC